MKVLFSPIGGTDPITNFRDGAMLHICRIYKPDKVYLYLSKEMCKLHDTSNPYIYCLDKLGELLDHHFEYEVIRRDNLEAVQVFDTFVKEFESVIRRIQYTEGVQEILVNVSSGTPAMKSALLLLSVLSEGRLIPVQVATPQGRMNPRVEEKNPTYDPQENWEVNEDNDGEVEDRSAIASSRNWMGEVKKEVIRKQIDSYHYVAAMQLARDTVDITSLSVKLLEVAVCRLHNDIRSMQNLLKGTGYEKSDAFLPVRDDRFRMIVEYALGLQIKLEKKEYADFVRAWSPLFKDLYMLILKKECSIDIMKDYSYNDRYWNEERLLENQKMYRILEENSRNGFRTRSPIENSHLAWLVEGLVENKKIREYALLLRESEKKVRNVAAHELISITEESIKKTTGVFPGELMQIVRKLVDRYITFDQKNVWKSYDLMNSIIKEEM